MVRDSTSYRGSFGLAMKVDQTPTSFTAAAYPGKLTSKSSGLTSVSKAEISQIQETEDLKATKNTTAHTKHEYSVAYCCCCYSYITQTVYKDL